MNPTDSPDSAAEAPVAPAAAVPTPPAPVQPAAPAMPVQDQSLPAKKPKGLIYGIIGGLVVVCLLVLGWFMFLSPSAQAKRLSNSFMHNMTTGDVTKAVSQTNDASSKNFLETASKSVHGSYKMTDKQFSDNKGYYLYDLSGADDKYARTIIEKQSGKFVVTSFVFGNNQLKLVPTKGSDTSAQDTTEDTSKTPSKTSTPVTTASACLGPNDFLAINSVPVTAGYDGKYKWFDDVFFTADSTEYNYPGIMDDFYAGYGKFYTQNSTKDFTIALQGKVKSSTSDDVLASQRAEKVKAALLGVGIPAARIVIDNPAYSDNTLGAGDNGDANRNVGIIISSSNSCGNGR